MPDKSDPMFEEWSEEMLDAADDHIQDDIFDGPDMGDRDDFDRWDRYHDRLVER